MSALTSYEIQRAKAQAKNEALKLELLGTPVLKVEPPARKPAPKRKIRDDVPPAEPTRKSARSSTVRGVKPTAEEIREREEAEEAEMAALVAEANRIKHAPRSIQLLSSITGSAAYDTLAPLLHSLASPTLPTPSPRRSAAPKPPSKAATTSLSNSLSKLSLRGLVKTTPDRIYSLAVHPSTSKDLVFAGDKTGHIGLWDATEAGSSVRNGGIGNEGGEDEDEEGAVERSAGRMWYWEAHQRNAVSGLKFAPNDAGSLFSTAYDCTIRRTNFETKTSEEVIDGDVFESECLIHSLDFTPNGQEIWASDHNGGILHRDLREPIQTVQRWEIDTTKVGCISLNPANPFLAVTSHLKRAMKLWDLRKLSSTPQDGTKAEIDACLLSTYDYDKACSSAYFDPSGTRIVSTSYDDQIRVWSNINPKAESFDNALKKPTIVNHDNQTGRYLTVFKAQWATHGLVPHITAGNMDRKLDLISSSGEMLAQLYDDEFVTAVPAVTASHPTLPDRYYGGTGAGKVSFYGVALE